MSDLIGQSLGHYHILEQLGEGGMAIVYKAYDTRLERYVAIKIIRSGAFPANQLERMLKRFEREAKSLAKLSHPNIVGIIEYGEHDNSPYLVMEYLSGGMLKHRVGKPIPWQDAVCLIIPIAQALKYAHEHNIIHRDVKPSNILLTETGQPMLTDFGIAKILSLEETQDLTGTGVGIGTPEYMAPEQGFSHSADARVDIYALGVVFYEMITGRRPYVADTPMAVMLKKNTDPLPRPSSFVRNLPSAVENFLIKALAKSPNDRFASMEEFIAKLESILSGKTTFSKAQSAHSRERTIGSEMTIEEQGTTIREKFIPFQSFLSPAIGKGHGSKANLLRLWPIGLMGGMITIGLAIWLIVIAGKTDNAVIPPPVVSEPPVSTESPLVTDAPVLTEAPIVTDEPVTKVPFISDEIIDSKGITMRLVPEGTFIMGGSFETAIAECQKLNIGNPCQNEWFTDEDPIHTVYVDAFYMDKYEVSNGAYRVCVNNGACRVPVNSVSDTRSSYYGNQQFDEYPVIYVDWKMADGYCKWRGARLPTEAEWEKAASGTDGRLYLWGNTFDGSNVNFCDKNCTRSWANTIYNDSYVETAPVTAFPGGVSVYGIFNLAGNVFEWVADLYDPEYYSYSPSSNPTGPASGNGRVVKGGAWVSDGGYLRPAGRVGWDPSNPDDRTGFRCAKSATP